MTDAETATWYQDALLSPVTKNEFMAIALIGVQEANKQSWDMNENDASSWRELFRLLRPLWTTIVGQKNN